MYIYILMFVLSSFCEKEKSSYHATQNVHSFYSKICSVPCNKYIPLLFRKKIRIDN